MKAYVFHTETFIEPFGDHVSEAWVMNQSLAECQRRACQASGLELVRIHDPSQIQSFPCVLMPDYVYVSEKALRDFCTLSRKKNSNNARLAIKRCVSSQYSLALQDVELMDWQDESALVAYDVWLLDSGPIPDDIKSIRQTLEQRCEVLEIPIRELSISVRQPMLQQKQRSYDYPITSTVCCHISHWTHLLWLSHLSFGISWMELARSQKIRTGLKLLRALATAGSKKWRVLAKLNHLGSACDIHPSAYLEASILGDGVTVGAGAVIRNSIIGPNTVISDHAKVINSVIGARCLLTENYFILHSLCYPGSVLGNPKTQMAVIGRDVYLYGWTSFLDAKFSGDVLVMHKGKPTSSHKSFLACCVGHRAILGARVLIHAGRQIPNDLYLVSRPDDILVDIPSDLPENTPLVCAGGSLITLEEFERQERRGDRVGTTQDTQ